MLKGEVKLDLNNLELLQKVIFNICNQYRVPLGIDRFNIYSLGDKFIPDDRINLIIYWVSGVNTETNISTLNLFDNTEKEIVKIITSLLLGSHRESVDYYISQEKPTIDNTIYWRSSDYNTYIALNNAKQKIAEVKLIICSKFNPVTQWRASFLNTPELEEKNNINFPYYSLQSAFKYVEDNYANKATT